MKNSGGISVQKRLKMKEIWDTAAMRCSAWIFGVDSRKRPREILINYLIH